MATISFRAPNTLKMLLENVAKYNDRTLSDEVINRLKRSLREDNLIDEKGDEGLRSIAEKLRIG